jgi:hypothetical protein
MARRRVSELPNDAPRPEVIVDFNSQDGLLFVTLKNIGERSAHNVTTRFDKPFHGLGGRKPISELQLFKRVGFMPPGKEFSQFIDPVAAYFRRREPYRLTASITYADGGGRRFMNTVTHDLRIFRDLGHIRKTG